MSVEIGFKTSHSVGGAKYTLEQKERVVRQYGGSDRDVYESRCIIWRANGFLNGVGNGLAGEGVASPN